MSKQRQFNIGDVVVCAYAPPDYINIVTGGKYTVTKVTHDEHGLFIDLSDTSNYPCGTYSPNRFIKESELETI